MTGSYRHRKGDIYRRIAIAVGRYVSRANKSFSLAKSGRMALGAIKKFYPERSVRRAVQAALNACVTTATGD